MKVLLQDYMFFTGRKCVTLEKFKCHVSPPYIFSRFLETFTPIIELWRLESVRRHEVNTLYLLYCWEFFLKWLFHFFVVYGSFSGFYLTKTFNNDARIHTVLPICPLTFSTKSSCNKGPTAVKPLLFELSRIFAWNFWNISKLSIREWS
jgi:hypothetical protein